MTDTADSTLTYDILVSGELPAEWTLWFDDLEIHHTAEHNTLLRGPLIDQAALHGVLKRILNLGLPLISVNPTCAGDLNS